MSTHSLSNGGPYTRHSPPISTTIGGNGSMSRSSPQDYQTSSYVSFKGLSTTEDSECSPLIKLKTRTTRRTAIKMIDACIKLKCDMFVSL